MRVLSFCVNSCRSWAPFWTWNSGNTQFSALFSYMLWYIELTLGIRLYFHKLQIKFERCHFASIFVRVMLLLDCSKYFMQFSALFSTYALTYELKFFIWLYFYERRKLGVHIRFEGRVCVQLYLYDPNKMSKGNFVRRVGRCYILNFFFRRRGLIFLSSQISRLV